MDFHKMKVGTRLGFGFSLVLLLMAIVTLVGIRNMSIIQGRLDTVVNVKNVETRAVIDMNNSLSDRVVALKTLTLYTDAADMQPEIERIKSYEQKYREADARLSKSFASHEARDDEKKLLAQIKEYEQAASPAIARALELWQANKPEDATRLLIKEIRPVQKKWVEALGQLIELEDKINRSAAEDANRAFGKATMVMIFLGALAVLLGILAAWFITRGVLRQLGGEPDYAAEIANDIAQGDLSVHVETTDSGHESSLGALREMKDSLVKIVSQVRRGTEAIETASVEIATGNADLSSRIDLQAASLEKTASSMDQLTSTVRQNAENARQANELAVSASDVARRGGDVVTQVVETMDSISDSSKKIVDIISVIDGIAFQTNILALNAAVEAARAGEQGRGFAVVAGEVRSLAQRSAAAAKEIKALISDSVDKVSTGSQLVMKAGETMEEVVASVKRVTDIMNEITVASQEQSAGIELVNHAIIEMEGVVQQDAALVEQAAATAKGLQEQAHELAHVVSIFKLDPAHIHQAANPPAAAPRIAHKAAKPAPRPSPAPAPRAKPAAPKAAAKARPAEDGWEEF
ncbi:methyl-accepting chemotaxis protein [Massilia sp. W12]|uniref:methyl-accepting chemotaxis protein n=1 Tax=Massilia sp. W12 TaxID=3126507 RepID=UPI0030CF35FF